MAIASLILLPFALRSSRSELRSLGRERAILLVGVGAVLAIHFYAFITAVKLTTVASAVLLVTSHPLIVGLVSYFVLRESSRLSLVGILLGFAGVVAISYTAADGGDPLGNALALLGMVMAAVYILVGRLLRQRISLVTYVFVVYASCTLFLFLWCIAADVPLWPYPWEEIAIFASLAVFSTIFGHTLFNWSLRYVPAAVVSASFLGEPVGASILAAILLQEVPSSNVLLGGVLVVIGIILTAARPGALRRQGDGSSSGH